MEHRNAIQVLEDENENEHSIANKIINDGNYKKGFFICNTNEIIKKYNEWNRLFPFVESFYVVHCNDTRIVLEVVAALGVGFSCVSKEEIRRVISLGVPPNKIIFANTTKKISHLKYAAKERVGLMTFDNEEELYKINNFYPSSKLILRVCTTKDGSYIRKFGASPGKEVKHLLLIAKSLDLNVVGVAFQIDTTFFNYKEFTRALEVTKMVFNVARELGYNFNIVDIGGGGGLSENDEGDIKNVASTINQSLKHHFPGKEVRFVAEPGRYFVETAFKLASFIHSRRTMSDGIRMYHLDIGVYHGLAPVIYNKCSFTCTPLQEETSEVLYPSILWGPTCDSTDKISKDVENLPKMNIGDWVIFENTGAYTLPITYEFNRFMLPNIHSIISKSNWLFILEKASVPIARSRFTTGDSIDNYMTGLNNSIYNSFY